MPNIINQPAYTGRSFTGRLWYNLGTAKVVRAIFIGMIIYFLIIGGLVVGYSRVQQCLSDYSDLQAESSAARAQAATIDRDLNARVDELSTSERARLRSDQDAFLDLMNTLLQGKGNEVDSAVVQNALAKVRKVNEESAEIGRANDAERARIVQLRARADALRQLNPVPDAPSKTC